MNWFEMINNYYNSEINGEKLWDINRVKKSVELNILTKEQYKEITGEDYIR